MLQIKFVLIASIYSGDIPGTFRHKGEGTSLGDPLAAHIAVQH